MAGFHSFPVASEARMKALSPYPLQHQAVTSRAAPREAALADRRQAAMVQRRLAEAANNSPRQQRLAAVAQMMKGSARAAGASAQRRANGAHLTVPAMPANTVAQAYNIKYGGLNNGSGTDMHVYIDGKNDADLGKGSAPSVTPAWWPATGTAERNYLAQYAVQGHLLNNLLGGPGDDMKNLTPITKSTNTTHFKKIEDTVKQAVAADYGVEYRVRAFYNSHPPLSDFGVGAPGALAALLPNFAGEIGADYDIYDRNTKQKLSGAPGELLIKNEGAHKKGTF
jgi:hypothetical protein